jgi:hypothetical protein
LLLQVLAFFISVLFNHINTSNRRKFLEKKGEIPRALMKSVILILPHLCEEGKRRRKRDVSFLYFSAVLFILVLDQPL